MQIYRVASVVCAVLAILLSDVMCAVVAYNYCFLQWGAVYEGFSAPADVAFLYAVPFGAGIVLCSVLAWVFHTKVKR